MMTLSSRVAATAIVSLFLMGSAFAESAAPAATPKAEKPRTAASLECSKEADAQNIHGKKRHKFMSKCKHDAKAGAAPQ
jgi:psiF repeat